MAMWKVRIPCRSTTTLPHTSSYHSLRTGVFIKGTPSIIGWRPRNSKLLGCFILSTIHPILCGIAHRRWQRGTCFLLLFWWRWKHEIKETVHISWKSKDYFSWNGFFVQTIVWERVYKQHLQGTTLLYSFNGRLGLPGISTSPWWVSTNPWLPKSITAPTSHGHYSLTVKNAICAVFNGKPILMCCWKRWQLTRSKTCRERLLVICPISCVSWLWLCLFASTSRIPESRLAPATKTWRKYRN